MGSPLASPAEIVLAADTTVDVKGEILEKPLDADDAYRMLRMLSGRTHLVHTGVTVSVPITGARRSSTIVVATEVTFGDLEDAAIDWYLGTGAEGGHAGARRKGAGLRREDQEGQREEVAQWEASGCSATPHRPEQ